MDRTEKKTFQIGNSRERTKALQELPEEVMRASRKVVKNAANHGTFGQLLRSGPDSVAKSIEVDLNRIKPSEGFNLQVDGMIFIEKADSWNWRQGHA